MQTVREFNHRTFGQIGRVVLDADVKSVKLNGKDLPIGSIEYLLNFALQSLQDAYAGAKSEAEAQGAFNTKLDRLVAGTIGVRLGGGASASEETKIARQITKAALKAKLDKDEFDALTDERLDEVFEKNEAKLRPMVDARLAELAKERERKAKLAKASGELEL